MSVTVKVQSRVPMYKKETLDKLDDIVLGLAGEVERLAKRIIPHNKGILQSSVRVDKIAPYNYEVSSGSVPGLSYAARIEFDENLTYSKAGKKPHALQYSAIVVQEKVVSRIKAGLK